MMCQHKNHAQIIYELSFFLIINVFVIILINTNKKISMMTSYFKFNRLKFSTFSKIEFEDVRMSETRSKMVTRISRLNRIHLNIVIKNSPSSGNLNREKPSFFLHFTNFFLFYYEKECFTYFIWITTVITNN